MYRFLLTCIIMYHSASDVFLQGLLSSVSVNEKAY